MGYRSQVVAVFYASNVVDFPVLKLWLDENFPMKEWSNHVRWFDRGVVFEIEDIKWYDSYPDIISFNETADAFRDLFCQGTKEMLAGAYEFMRIGEDYDDVEVVRDGDHDYVLECSRVAHVNV